MAKPEWLGDLSRDALSLVRTSDTLRWLRTDAADVLQKRSSDRIAELDRIRDALRSDPHRLPEFNHIARFAQAEAALQLRLARWLKEDAETEGQTSAEEGTEVP